MKALIGLIILLLSQVSFACSPPNLLGTSEQTPLTRVEAEEKLTQTLITTYQHSSEYWQDAASIDCYLQQHTVPHPMLETIRLGLSDLNLAIERTNQLTYQATVNQINLSIARDSGTGQIQFPSRSGGATIVDLYVEVLAKFCTESASSECAESTQVAQNLWHIAGFYRSRAAAFNQTDKRASLQYNQTLDAQWRSYKDDTIKLWPHEVLLNSLVYRPSTTGISGPPKFKLLAARPALGLSYLSDQSHRIQPTLNIDLLGIYWWQYSDSQPTTAMPGRGVAASLIWDGEDAAYGISYHHNPKWSVSLAHGDDNNVVVSVSLQLAYWLLR